MNNSINKQAQLAQTIMENIPCVALTVCKGTREVVAVNKFAQGVGISPGKPCFEAWFGFDEPCAWCLAPKLWETGEPQQLEFKHAGAIWDGHWAPMDDDLYLHYAFDVTTRTHAEQALRKSESRYRAVVEDQTEFIARMDFDLVISFANDAYCRFRRLSRHELIGQKLEDITGRSIAERIKAALGKLTPENPVVVNENLRLMSDGKTRWIAWTNRLIVDDESNPVEYQVVGRDITERVHAEQALQESEKRFRSIVENTDAGYFFIDKHGIIQNVNDACVKMYKYDSQEEIIGQHFAVVQQVDDLEQAKEFVAGIMRGNSHYQTGEFSRKCKDGSLGYHTFSARPVQHGEEVTGIEGFIIDSTERRQVEDALVESQRMAGLGTLAAGIAHEVNSPLQIITGTSESMARRISEGKLDEERLLKNAKNINQSAWRIARIIRSLMIYTGSTHEAVEPHDLNEIVRDALVLIEHQLRTWSNIHLNSLLAEDLPALYCERNGITQVLINLLNNAKDSMPRGGEVTIRTAYDAESRQVWLQVSDTGHGIPEEIRSRLFDPFFSSTRTIGKGPGLGLSIAAGIVQAHGGEVKVDSEPGQGTTFTVILPEQPPEME